MPTPYDDIPDESIDQLAASLQRERLLKTLALFAVFLWLALNGGQTHAYWPIVMFALVADLMSLNRQRRLVAAIAARDRSRAVDDELEV